MLEQLVVNGCSYAKSYTTGGGHVDLAKRFDLIPYDLSITGSANTRIIRSTLKHSYETDLSTLYVLGFTFVSREELPICKYDASVNATPQDIWEGAWTNPQNQYYGKNRWVNGWTDQHTKEWIVFRETYEQLSLIDRVENLMYQILSMIDSLTARGHRVLVFQQADEWWHGMSNAQLDRLKLLENVNIIDQFRWCAIRWQHSLNVPGVPSNAPVDMRHRQPGSHKPLNDYLENYIRQHELQV
jgi:hypothetical protein